MSTDVTETDSYPSAIPTPVLGDRFTYPAVVTDALTKLASRSKYFASTLAGNSGTTASLAESDVGQLPESNTIVVPTTARSTLLYNLGYNLLGKIAGLRQYIWGSTTLFFHVPVNPVVESDGGAGQVNPGTNWTVSAASDFIKWNQATIPVAAPRLWWDIYGLPPAGRIQFIACELQGAAHGSLPGTMPILSLFRQTAGNSPALVGSVNDTSANTTAYASAHLLSVDIDEPIQPNCKYFFRLEGEAGANKAVGLALRSSYLSISEL